MKDKNKKKISSQSRILFKSLEHHMGERFARLSKFMLQKKPRKFSLGEDVFFYNEDENNS